MKGTAPASAWESASGRMGVADGVALHDRGWKRRIFLGGKGATSIPTWIYIYIYTRDSSSQVPFVLTKCGTYAKQSMEYS